MNINTINALQSIQDERLELGRMKSNDYSGVVDNIKLCGLDGIALRIFDKACRLLSLTKHGTTREVPDETLEDTLKDLGNYADYGVCLMRGQWEGTEQST